MVRKYQIIFMHEKKVWYIFVICLKANSCVLVKELPLTNPMYVGE